MRFTPNIAKTSHNAQDTDITNAALPEDRKHWYRREVKSQKTSGVSY
ncbi:hypothetical protein H6H01_13865 [Nostoc calcicola FACHB-3891]|nr:hypothetical protein [Nostoc calcicola FACHB-3891]